MLSNDALDVFRKRLREAHLALESLSVADGFAAMASFYHDERAEDCDIEGDGDMLLAQWGPVVVKGEPTAFEVDVTRQFMGSEEDGEITQLSLTFVFPPDAELLAIKRGDVWFEKPDEASKLGELLASREVFELVAQRTDATVRLKFEAT